MKLRLPAVAGQFYPQDKKELKNTLSELCQPFHPKKSALGLLLPHAGYIYSGRVAGKTISKVNLKEIFVIIGPNHTGLGTAFSLNKEEQFDMPLGKVDINLQLADEILKNCPYLKKDTSAHRFEHSIEVQLPFLQFAKPGPFTIVPIIASDANLQTYKEIGLSIASAIKKLAIADKTQIIASSDMTHYEKAQEAKIKDEKAIAAILELNPDLLFNTVKKDNISMCGYIPAIIMLSAARELGAKTAELVKYENSGETSGDYNSVVSYAGIIIS